MTPMGEGAGDDIAGDIAGDIDMANADVDEDMPEDMREDMDMDTDTDTDTDLDWARDLFDGARGGPEPGWGTDVAALTRAGDRRRRRRMAGTGGGVLGAVAVTVAVAVTLGAGSTDHGSVTGPAGGWGGRKLQDVFRYAEVNGGGGGSADFFTHVPESAAVDVAALIGRLDPTGAHLRGSPAGPANPQPRIVGDDDSGLKDAMSLMMSSSWTPDGSYPGGVLSVPSARLEYDFFKDLNSLQHPVMASDAKRPQPCGLSVDFEERFHGLGPAVPAPQWTECRFTLLADGSKVGTTSAAFGAGTETVAVRIFGSGNVVALLGWDYRRAAVDSADPTAPVDARYVLTPSPWTQDAFRAALSDPGIGPVFPPMPAPNADGKLLMPVDLGEDWSFDLVQGPATTGEYVMDNGCGPDHSIFGLAPGRGLNYLGKLPDGTPATLFEGEYRLPAGTGAATMRDARKYAVGGCDPAPDVTFSDDTLTALPPGIGDDAFIENQPGQATVRINVRFGDTVLMVTVVRSDHKRLDLTSAEGRAWLEGIARHAAARWTSSGSGSAPAHAR